MAVGPNPIQKNLDQYLTDVTNFIDIKPDDYKKTKAIFESVFKQVKTEMEKKSEYFKSYSKEVLYAGSVYDELKITKLDEFDMDIVIRMPINYNEIVLEDYSPGFVRMKIKEMDHLDNQKNWEERHKVTRFWRDNDHYFLQNKFRQWIHSVVTGALGDLNNQVTVDTITYEVVYKESGPAYTLKIKNVEGNEEFKLDVDLVPVIRFTHPRWPPGQYRPMTESFNWLVVPKPNKALHDGQEMNRCWRLSFQEYERHIMKGCYQMKPTLRLVKKLRDSLKMKYIASYYIKTLFLRKIDETKDKKYWQKSLSLTFRIMVAELYNAVQNKNIPYFWNEEYNLIVNVKQTVLDSYADDLKKVIVSIDNNDVDSVMSYLLNNNELQEFKNSKFYERQPRVSCQGSTASVLVCRKGRNVIENVVSFSNAKSNTMDALPIDNSNILTKDDEKSEEGTVVILKSLDIKMDMIHQNLENQNRRLENLELAMGVKRDESINNLGNVEALCERLKNLEVAMNHKEKSREVDNAVIETLQLNKKNTAWSEHYGECSTSKTTNKDENDTILAKLVGCNERLKKLEESTKNSDNTFDEIDVAMTEVLQIDNKTTKNDNENVEPVDQQPRYKIYLNCDRPINHSSGASNSLKWFIDPLNLWH